MRRLEIASYGSIRAAIRFSEAPMPAVGDRDVLIDVQAASINPIDFKIASGALRRVQKLALPAAFGFDACGVVESAGRKVSRVAVGDTVYVRAPRNRLGSFAEYMVADEDHVARAPRGLSALQAASIPLVALTTVQALVDRAHAGAEQSVLIHAGSGGLGSFAIQYAKHVLGMNVTTTTSSKNTEWVAKLGADVVIAYDVADYRTLPARYDIVFDTLGGETTADSFAVLKHGGTVVSVAGPPDRQFAKQTGANPLVATIMWAMGVPMRLRAMGKGGHYFRFLTESDGRQLDHIAQVIASGKIKPVIDKVFEFDQAIEALEYAAQGRAKGKVVLKFDD